MDPTSPGVWAEASEPTWPSPGRQGLNLQNPGLHEHALHGKDSFWPTGFAKTLTTRSE